MLKVKMNDEEHVPLHNILCNFAMIDVSALVFDSQGKNLSKNVQKISFNNHY